MENKKVLNFKNGKIETIAATGEILSSRDATKKEILKKITDIRGNKTYPALVAIAEAEKRINDAKELLTRLFNDVEL